MGLLAKGPYNEIPGTLVSKTPASLLSRYGDFWATDSRDSIPYHGATKPCIRSVIGTPEWYLRKKRVDPRESKAREP